MAQHSPPGRISGQKKTHAASWCSHRHVRVPHRHVRVSHCHVRMSHHHVRVSHITSASHTITCACHTSTCMCHTVTCACHTASASHTRTCGLCSPGLLSVLSRACTTVCLGVSGAHTACGERRKNKVIPIVSPVRNPGSGWRAGCFGCGGESLPMLT